MYVNKYNALRRLLYRVYDILPAARVLKRASLPLKIRKLRGRIAARKAEVERVREASGRDPLFTHVEIETINRCNGECGFCPVNRHLDPRSYARMTDGLFRSIIDQLRELDFRRSLYLFSNNEPLLDTRIVDFAAYAREQLPHASVRMYSNGVVLTKELFAQLIPHVDVFTVNNYCEDFRLAPHLEEIHAFAQTDPGMAAKLHLVMRYQREIMTSRGGLSPNKQDILSRTLSVGCLLPARQLIIRPDGKLSLCCNDALGKMTLGDLNERSIADIWFGEEYAALRRTVLESRGALELCRNCDTIHF